jgi:hypothetical protein
MQGTVEDTQYLQQRQHTIEAEWPSSFEHNVSKNQSSAGQWKPPYLLLTDISNATWAGLQKACDEVVDPIWMLGDFNANLHDADDARVNSATGTAAGNTRGAEIQAFISTLGISNYSRTKLHRMRQGTWTWHCGANVQGAGQHVKSMCDYILGQRLDPVVKYHTRAIKWIQMDHQMVYINLLIQQQQHMAYIVDGNVSQNVMNPRYQLIWSTTT